MSRNLLARYIWIIDTIRRYGSITRERLNELWMQSPYSDGDPMPRRTFYNYRTAIEELFNINIECNTATYEYYIDSGDSHQESVTDWLLNSAAMSNVLSNVSDISDCIFLEDVSSARLYLSQVISALRGRHPLRFTYRPYTRVNPTRDVVVEPYFLVKTYALDRMEDVRVDAETFERDPSFDPESFVKDSFGIIFTQAEPRDVVIRTSPRQAKYLRALPLHPSQHEEIHDDYSLFHYRLRLTPDLVQELLSHGPDIRVVEPPELRAMVTTALRDALKQYD